MILWGASTNGPAAVPGTYEVRLTVDGQQQTQPLVVRRHPLRSATDADLKEQFDLAIRIRDKVSEANQAVIDIRAIKSGVDERVQADSSLAAQAEQLKARLSAVEEELYQVRLRSNQDPLNFPIKLNNKLAALQNTVEAVHGAPTAQAYVVFEELSQRLDAELQELNQVLEQAFEAFNEMLESKGLEPIANPRPRTTT